MTSPFTGEYRDGEMVQCQRCAKNVRVKYYDRDTVVVVSTQEQQTLALRCQYCGYVMCDSCAHPADSLFPICPSCQREWGPYYFTHDAIMPSSAPSSVKPAPVIVAPIVEEAQPFEHQRVIEPVSATVETLGAGETDLSREYRVWERKKGIKRIFSIIVIFLIMGLLIYLALGPGKPVVKKGLSLLSARPTHAPAAGIPPDDTPTPTRTAATSQATKNQSKTSNTPIKPSTTSTVLAAGIPTTKITTLPISSPTSTSTASPAVTATLEPTLTVPVLGENDCIPALSVTLDDVGKTMCVTGTVVFTLQNETSFSIFFSNEDGYFRIVIYDRIPTDIKKDVCIKVTGVIKSLTDIPVMALGYHDVIEICTP